MRMQFYLPESARKPGAKFNPRHFVMLADAFARTPLAWTDDLAATEPGCWVMVIRAPGSSSMGRETAASHAKGAFLFDRILAHEYRALIDRDGALLIDLGWEVLSVDRAIVRGIATSLAALPIDAARLRILHCNQAARAAFEALWRSEGLGDPPVTIEYPIAIALMVAYQIARRDDEAIAARRAEATARTTDGGRTALFLSFNGEVRLHRLLMAAMLEARGLLARGRMSLIAPRKGSDETMDALAERLLADMRYHTHDDMVLAAARTVISRLPMTLDIAGLPTGTIDTLAWTGQDPAFYDASRLTLVIDTGVGAPDELHVTEKVLKPIINHSPFMLVGSPAAPRLLRDYGFETFEPLLCQPNRVGGSRTVIAAVDEIARLAAFSDADLDAFSRATIERCDANADHFWNRLPAILAAAFERDVLAPLARPTIVDAA